MGKIKKLLKFITVIVLLLLVVFLGIRQYSRHSKAVSAQNQIKVLQAEIDKLQYQITDDEQKIKKDTEYLKSYEGKETELNGIEKSFYNTFYYEKIKCEADIESCKTDIKDKKDEIIKQNEVIKESS